MVRKELRFLRLPLAATPRVPGFFTHQFRVPRVVMSDISRGIQVAIYDLPAAAAPPPVGAYTPVDDPPTVDALGNYTVSATVSNNDNDWPGDEEWTAATVNLTITLAGYYTAVANEFSATKAYISANLNIIARLVIMPTFNGAIASFNSAWAKYLSHSTAGSVVSDLISQAFTNLVGCEVTVLNYIYLIGGATAAVLHTDLRGLENNLVLFAGFVVGTKVALELALATDAGANLAAYVSNSLPSSCGSSDLGQDFKDMANTLDGAILTCALGGSLGPSLSAAACEAKDIRSDTWVLAARGTITAAQEQVLFSGLAAIQQYLAVI